VRNDVLGQNDEPVPAVARTVRSRTIPRPLLELTASELLLLLLLFFPEISFGQESPDPPLNHAQSERKPFFSDVTIWTAQTVGSVNVMSTYPGQEMFAAGIGLRRHLFNFRHTMVRWNFEVIPVCMPSFPGANGRTYHYVEAGGGGFGFRATQKMARSAAVYRRELWPAGIYDPNARGHAKNELLTAIRPGIGVPAAWEKFAEDRDHLFPFFEYAHRKEQSRV
jgi:hypothetical protein